MDDSKMHAHAKEAGIWSVLIREIKSKEIETYFR